MWPFQCQLCSSTGMHAALRRYWWPSYSYDGPFLVVNRSISSHTEIIKNSKTCSRFFLIVAGANFNDQITLPSRDSYTGCNIRDKPSGSGVMEEWKILWNLVEETPWAKIGGCIWFTAYCTVWIRIRDHIYLRSCVFAKVGIPTCWLC